MKILLLAVCAVAASAEEMRYRSPEESKWIEAKFAEWNEPRAPLPPPPPDYDAYLPPPGQDEPAQVCADREKRNTAIARDYILKARGYLKEMAAYGRKRWSERDKDDVASVKRQLKLARQVSRRG